MREKLSLIAAGALALAVPAVAAEQMAWSRASSPDGAFSVETPCSAVEVDRAKALPVDIVGGPIRLFPTSRVICAKGDILFVAGVIEDPSRPKTAPAVFDRLVEMKKSLPANGDTRRLTTINGHRAWLSRGQADDTKVAQIGFVEVSRTSLIYGVAGGDAGLDADQQAAMVDRFFGSIQVVAQ